MMESPQEIDPSPHRIRTLPILILFPHNRCNCRCVMCDIWRIQQVRELTVRDLEAQIESIRELRVRWVVFSGGEPQLNKDLATLSRMLRAEGIRVTLLTAGLLLERNARSVADIVDDITVSLDGPLEVHDQIRRVPGAFDRLARGLKAVRSYRPDIRVNARCTVQKLNFARLRDTVQAAKEIHLSSISFLAADVTSEAFNRPGFWQPERQGAVALDIGEVVQLDREIEALIRDCPEDICSGFIAESPAKLRRITSHFLAHLGKVPARAPSCNAPWVSSVIEADGMVRPCFFHRALGNIHETPLKEILNGPEAVAFREQLDVAANPICRNCVCSLYLPPEKVEG
ncbi:MAG: radical SAM protein [Terriglobia bacterium]